MKLKYNFVVRQVGEKAVGVAVGSDNQRFNGMINLNATGEFIFRRLIEGVDMDSLVSDISAKYDISPSDAKDEAEAFISVLKKGGLLEE